MQLQTLHGLTLLAFAGLLVRLYLEGLHDRYRTFFWALAFELGTSVLLFFIPPKSDLYGLTYFAASGFNWALRFLVLRELCLLVFHDHPGIRAAVRIGIVVSSILAMVIPATMLAVNPHRAAKPEFPYLELYFLLEQSMTFFLAVLFAGTIAFVTWFPVSLRRNIVLFCLGFSIRFIGEGGALLTRNLTESETIRNWANTGNMIVGLAVPLLWLGSLGWAGEKPLVSVSELLRPGHAEESLDLLNRVNAFLTRVLPNKQSDK